MALLPKFGSLRDKSWPPSTEWSGLNYWWGRDGSIKSTGLKKNKTAVPPHFHCWCLVTVTFRVICTSIYLINIWQVVSFQVFLLHCRERSPASPRPWATQGQTSPKSQWPSRLVCFRCSSVPHDSHGSDMAFISLLSLAGGRQLSSEG